MPLISVILPTYNRPGFLMRALASIASQTFDDYEVIVINDGGEDVSQYASWYQKARYMSHPKNRGLAAARNTGIKEAAGQYIAYLDDDDVWLPSHLQTLVKILETGIGAAYTDSYFWYNEQELCLDMSYDFNRSAMHHANLFPVINVMHRRDVLEKCGVFDETLGSHEDYDLWLRMMRHTDFVHIPIVTALYSKRQGNDQMSNDRLMMIAGWQKVRSRYA
jgi:glycosyltransferase involved in cell wall biosynthesis